MLKHGLEPLRNRTQSGSVSVLGSLSCWMVTGSLSKGCYCSVSKKEKVWQMNRKLWEAWNHVTGQRCAVLSHNTSVASRACHSSSVPGILQQNLLEGCHAPPPGDLPDPGLNPHLLCLPHWLEGSLLTSATWEPLVVWNQNLWVD